MKTRGRSSLSDERASRLRQSLSRLRDQSGKLLDVFLDRSPLTRGSVYELRRKCGKPSCVCATGKSLHSCLVVTWYAGGKKRLRSLSSREKAELSQLTECYRHFRQARARLVALHAKTLSVIDLIEVARRREP